MSANQGKLNELVKKKGDLEFQMKKLNEQKKLFSSGKKPSSVDKQLELKLKQLESQYKLVKTQQESLTKFLDDDKAKNEIKKKWK